MSTYLSRTSKKKRFLVLATTPHDYKEALSDLAGIDGKSHGNNPKKAVLAVRNWFVDTVHLETAPGASAIWDKFIDLHVDFARKEKLTVFRS